MNTRRLERIEPRSDGRADHMNTCNGYTLGFCFVRHDKKERTRSDHRWPAAQSGIARCFGLGGRMVEIGRCGIGKFGWKHGQRQNREHRRSSHHKSAERAIVGRIAFIVQVNAIATMLCLTYRMIGMLVVQQQPMHRFQRPRSRENQGQCPCTQMPMY